MSDKLVNDILNDFLKERSFVVSEIPISSLQGGKSKAKLFKFNVAGSYFVLKLLPATASHSTSLHQIILAKTAGEIGVGPQISYIDPSLKAMIMHYIAGKEAKSKDFQDLLIIDKMADFLQKLHHDGRLFPIAVSPFERFNKFIQERAYQNDQLKHMKLYMSEIGQVLNFYPIATANAHLDLHLTNIILSDKNDICFVDWVNGGISDPYFDLATFSIFSELDNLQKIRLLTSYFKREPNEIEWARFNVILPVRPMVIAASFLASDSNNANAKIYSEMSVCLIENEEFRNSLKLLKDHISKKTI